MVREFGWAPEALWLEEQAFGQNKKRPRRPSVKDKERLKFSLDVLIGHISGVIKGIEATLPSKGRNGRLPHAKVKTRSAKST